MIRFFHFYRQGHFTLVDVTVVRKNGQRCYTASLSANPRVSIEADSAVGAVERLKTYLDQLDWYNEVRYA